MVESTCFQHTSSHPDKYNNSVDRIISKEEEREDPRRDSSIYLRVQNTVVFPHSYKNYSVYTQSSKFPAIPCYSTYRINSSPRNTTTSSSSRAGSFQQLFPVSPSILHGRIRLPASLQYSRATQHKQGFQLILPSRKQHSKQQPASTQPLQQVPGRIHLVLQESTWYYRNSTRRNRILSKGLSIVCPCNTKVSVFQFSCYKNINSIQSSSNSMQRYSTFIFNPSYPSRNSTQITVKWL